MKIWGGFSVIEFVKGFAEGLTQEMIILPVLSYHALNQAHLTLIPILYEEHEV